MPMDLSLKERDRISVLRQVKEGVLSVSAGAARIGVMRRRFHRLRQKGSSSRGIRPWCTDCAGVSRAGR